MIAVWDCRRLFRLTVRTRREECWSHCFSSCIGKQNFPRNSQFLLSHKLELLYMTVSIRDTVRLSAEWSVMLPWPILGSSYQKRACEFWIDSDPHKKLADMFPSLKTFNALSLSWFICPLYSYSSLFLLSLNKPLLFWAGEIVQGLRHILCMWSTQV